MRSFSHFGKNYLLAMLVLLYGMLPAQELKKDGTFTIDFGKKKAKTDSTAVSAPTINETDEEDMPQTKAVRRQRVSATVPKTYAVFNALFIGGLNACQVDGDQDYGYYYLGAHFGVGALIRFHPSVSASVELLYSMKVAQDRLIVSPNTPANHFKIIYDYVAVAPSLQYHFRNLFYIGLGPVMNVMVRHKEYNRDGLNITNSPPTGQPRRIDWCLRGELTFLIKRAFGLGGGFEYTVLPLRPSLPNSRVHGMFNNVINLRFTYLMAGIKKRDRHGGTVVLTNSYDAR